MHVTVIAPESAVFDGDADSVIAPAFDGEVGILPDHAPFMTLLGEGPLTIKQSGTEHMFKVRGGFLQVVRNQIRVVTEEVKAEGE